MATLRALPLYRRRVRAPSLLGHLLVEGLDLIKFNMGIRLRASSTIEVVQAEVTFVQGRFVFLAVRSHGWDYE